MIVFDTALGPYKYRTSLNSSQKEWLRIYDIMERPHDWPVLVVSDYTGQTIVLNPKSIISARVTSEN